MKKGWIITLIVLGVLFSVQQTVLSKQSIQSFPHIKDDDVKDRLVIFMTSTDLNSTTTHAAAKKAVADAITASAAAYDADNKRIEADKASYEADNYAAEAAEKATEKKTVANKASAYAATKMAEAEKAEAEAADKAAAEAATAAEKAVAEKVAADRAATDAEAADKAAAEAATAAEKAAAEKAAADRAGADAKKAAAEAEAADRAAADKAAAEATEKKAVADKAAAEAATAAEKANTEDTIKKALADKARADADKAAADAIAKKAAADKAAAHADKTATDAIAASDTQNKEEKNKIKVIVDNKKVGGISIVPEAFAAENEKNSKLLLPQEQDVTLPTSGGIIVTLEQKIGGSFVTRQDELTVKRGDQSFTISNQPAPQSNTSVVSSPQLEINANNVLARSSMGLSVDPLSGILTVQTPTGPQRVSIMPDEALGIVIELKALTMKNGAEPSILLVSENGSLMYRMSGERVEKFLGLFPISIQKQILVATDTGSIVKVELSLLSQILSFFTF